MKTHRTTLRLFIFVSILMLAACNLGASTSVQPEAEVVIVTSESQIRLTCDQLIDTAIATVGAACNGLDSNQACYGNRLVNTELQSDTNTIFDASGDTTDLVNLRRVSATPLDEENQTWGIALIKAQANLPDTQPGQNVTFILFGETTLENVSNEMNAVTLSTGVGQTTCADAPPSALLVQSPEGVQVTLTLNGASVTMGSTLYMTAAANGDMIIATIEGVGVVGAFDTVRVIQAGAQTRLPLGGSDGLQVTGAPSEPEPFDTVNIGRAPLTLLDRPVNLPVPLGSDVTMTVQPSNIVPGVITQTLSACTPRADWTGIYTIRAGDTLSNIARTYGLTLDQLQQGNCISNANLINAGQVIRVPALVSTAVPSSVSFYADQTTVEVGQCTTLRWTTGNPSAVYFEDEATTAQNARQVCPSIRTTYTLLVVNTDGSQTPYTVTIDVTTQPTVTSAPVCMNQICEPGETNQTCPRDCPPPEPICGNQVCESSENPNTCTADCMSPICGNQVCEATAGENTRTCSADCGG